MEPKPSTARRMASQTKVNQEQIRQQQLKKLEALNKSHFLFPNGDVGAVHQLRINTHELTATSHFGLSQDPCKGLGIWTARIRSNYPMDVRFRHFDWIPENVWRPPFALADRRVNAKIKLDLMKGNLSHLVFPNGDVSPKDSR